MVGGGGKMELNNSSEYIVVDIPPAEKITINEYTLEPIYGTQMYDLHKVRDEVKRVNGYLKGSLPHSWLIKPETRDLMFQEYERHGVAPLYHTSRKESRGEFWVALHYLYYLTGKL
jgi:hypothetical protein